MDGRVAYLEAKLPGAEVVICQLSTGHFRVYAEWRGGRRWAVRTVGLSDAVLDQAADVLAVRHEMRPS